MRKIWHTAPTIFRWKQRFEEAGIAGLDAWHKGSQPRVADAKVQARIARKTQQKPAERHGFEYYRDGTLSLYAALDVKTGEVHGMTAARHTSREFLAFLTGLVDRVDGAKEIHVVLDNLSAHKTKDVDRFLTEHRRVRFHFTPTYSSWLNKVELWFAKIQRDVSRAVSLLQSPIWETSCTNKSVLTRS